ncbi:MAG: hypothetical protein H6934_03595 [Burkholderiaceae bacterium]|nr:hypothetical protein [Burkholderiaceae bacterium]
MSSTRFTIIASAVIVGATLAACASTESALTEKGMKPLTGPQIDELLGKETRWNVALANGNRVELRVAADHGTTLSWVGGQASGRLWTTATGYCSEYKTLGDGKPHCYRMYRIDAKTFKSFRDTGDFAAEGTRID